MNRKDYLFLFDIDGTILDARGSGRKAFHSSAELVLGRTVPEIEMLGGIDCRIFKSIYEALGFHATGLHDKWREFQKVYLAEMAVIAVRNDWILFPNSTELISRLSSESCIALVTGNIREGALLKLRKYGLDRYFKTGGFGDAAESRAALVEDALSQAQAHFGRRWDKSRIFLFGDTMIDVQSALDNGIQPVLIDHKERFTDTFKELPVNYYGKFKNIELFLNGIFSDQPEPKVNFFSRDA